MPTKLVKMGSLVFNEKCIVEQNIPRQSKNCCVICLKSVAKVPVENKTVNEDKEEFERSKCDLKIFLTLLGRYLEKGDFFKKFSVNLEVCVDCRKILVSFYALYHQISCLELEMEWKILKLKNIMKSANRVTSRVIFFHETFSQSELRAEVESWRKTVIQKCIINTNSCEYKLSTRYPKVTLKKLTIDDDKTLQIQNKPHGEVDFGSGSIEDHICLTDYNNFPKDIATLSLDVQDLPSAVAEVFNPVSIEVSVASFPIPEECNLKTHIMVKLDTENEEQGINVSPVFSHPIKSDSDQVRAISDTSKCSGVNEVEFNSDEYPECETPLPLAYCNDGFENKVKVENFIEEATILSTHNEQFDSSKISSYPTSSYDINSSEEIERKDDDSLLESESAKLIEKIKQISTEDVHMDVTRALSSEDQQDVNVSQDKTNCNTAKILPSISRLRMRFACSKCGRTFSSSSNLENHLKIHEFEEEDIDNEFETDEESEDDYVISDSDSSDDSGFMYGNPFNSTDCEYYDKDESEKLVADDEQTTSKPIRFNTNSVHIDKNCTTKDVEPFKNTFKRRRVEEDFDFDKFPCSVCPIKSHCMRDRERHFKVQHGDRDVDVDSKVVHKCQENSCSAYFRKPYQLHNHMFRFHKKTGDKVIKFACSICPSKYWTPAVLRYHHRTHHDAAYFNLDQANIWKCHCDPDHCSAYFLMIRQLKKHYAECHPKSKLTYYPCDVCPENFPHQDALDQHNVIYHVLKSDKQSEIKCQEANCSSYFLTESQLSRHMKLHHSPKKPPAETTCKVCGYGKSSSSNIKVHFKTHHDLTNVTPDQVHNCEDPSCTAYFLKRVQLNVHMMKIHGKTSSWKRCDDCGKEFKGANRKGREQLRRHRFMKHFDKLKYKFVCKVKGCYRQFEWEEELGYHAARHNDTDVLCPICGETKKSANIKWHIRSHEGKKPIEPRRFCCDQCGKVFKLKARLNQHCLVHSGTNSWKYQCSICDKKCMTSQKLEEHMRTHSKEKPFVCQYCGEKYGHKHNLRNHVNSKHADIVKDTPRAFDKTNLTSRKGIRKNKK